MPPTPLPHRLPLGILGAIFFLVTTTPTSAQPTSAQLERIAALVEEGATREALIRVQTLLEVFPGDPQLVAIEKLLAVAPQPSPKTTAPIAQPTTPSLAAEDKLEFDTVLHAARQALQNGDPQRRDARLKTLLARPIPAAAQAPGAHAWLPYWQTRAAAALAAKDWQAGWQAGQALLALGARESDESSLRQTLAALNAEGWLEPKRETLAATMAARRWQPWLGTWKTEAVCYYREKGDGYSTSSGHQTSRHQLKIELLYNQPSVSISTSTDERDSTWRGDNNSGHTIAITLSAPGKHIMQSRSWGHSSRSDNFSATVRVTDISLNDTGDTLTIQVAHTPDYGDIKAGTAEYKYLLSADGQQLYLPNTENGQTRADFARHGGKLYHCKDYTYFDAPVLIALAKQP